MVSLTSSYFNSPTSFSSLHVCVKRLARRASSKRSVMFPYSNHAVVPPSFLRNRFDNGITPEHDDPFPNSPESDSPESSTTGSVCLDPDCHEPHSSESDYPTTDTTEPEYIDPGLREPHSHGVFFVTESSEARKMPPTNGYTSKVRVLDRYKVVGFISSGTYGRVYKAVGHNGMAGEFAIKKFGKVLLRCTLTVG